MTGYLSTSWTGETEQFFPVDVRGADQSIVVKNGLWVTFKSGVTSPRPGVVFKVACQECTLLASYPIKNRAVAKSHHKT